MTHDDVQRWLDGYVAAWRSYDRAAIEALFTDDCAYRYGPWDDATVGAQAIADAWLENRDAPNSWQATYAPVAVEGDVAVAQGRTTYFEPDRSEAGAWDNVFIVRFAPDGRAREFTEWFRERPKAAAD